MREGIGQPGQQRGKGRGQPGQQLGSTRSTTFDCH
jgi:hypothetical protein